MCDEYTENDYTECGVLIPEHAFSDTESEGGYTW